MFGVLCAVGVVGGGGGGGEVEGFEFSHIALVVPKLLTLVVNLIN